MSHLFKLTLLCAIIVSPVAQAAEFVRWTGKDDINGEFNHVLESLSGRMGITLDAATFKLNEERDLAFTRFRHYLQTINGTPVEGASIRVWTDLATGHLVQMEANIERPQQLLISSASARGELSRRLGRAAIASHKDLISTGKLRSLVMAPVRGHDDHHATFGKSHVVWSKGRLVQVSFLNGKRGTHEVRVDLLNSRVISSVYYPFPRDDQHSQEIELEADVFPVYEEANGVILPRQRAKLRHILPTVRTSAADPFSPIRDSRYLESMMNAERAKTPEGRRAGYWSEELVVNRVAALASAVPELSNRFESGLSLAGRYCSVMLHSDAIRAFAKLPFTPKFSSNATFDWRQTEFNGHDEWEMLVASSYYGKPVSSPEEAASRPATRHPFHDPQTYINEGFDELQVYAGVSQFFDSLHARGFTDPELSTRPFTAYLFNPDIAMRDNAYYTNDTINFTTYSPTEPNAARDNLTIWHELGHGLMDRLMGNAFGGYLKLADTGGLSEGMADFTADLILQSVVGSADFPGRAQMRILNNTGFLLTNEVHDDGEAYGGTMHDILERAIERWGVEGLHKVTDLTLETMRFTRYHPHLTAADFFDHMIFADEVGRPGVRAPGELASIIYESLARRNFVAGTTKPANLSLKHEDREILAGEPGSRDHEIAVELAESETKTLPISFSVSDGDSFQFQYPLKARLYKARRGALQGAIHWVGEEQEPAEFTINSASQITETSVEVSGKCDYVNREDGICSDYVYLQIFDATVSTELPVAKKRFYVKVRPKAKTAN